MSEPKDSFRTIVIAIVDGESFSAKVVEAVSRAETNGKGKGVRIETTNREVPEEEWTTKEVLLVDRMHAAYQYRDCVMSFQPFDQEE